MLEDLSPLDCRLKKGNPQLCWSFRMNFVSKTIGLEVREGISPAMSSKILSWNKGFLFMPRVGLSNSPGTPLPLNPDSELHSFEESAPVIKMHDFALKIPVEASSKSNSNSSIFEGISKSSRATLALILEALLTGEGLYILGTRPRHSD